MSSVILIQLQKLLFVEIIETKYKNVTFNLQWNILNSLAISILRYKSDKDYWG